MAHSAQAKKRIRQNDTRRLANRSVKSELRTLTKRLQEHVANSDRAGADELLKSLTSKLDKASRRSVLHTNTAARKKAQLARLVNSISSLAAWRHQDCRAGRGSRIARWVAA